MDQDADEGPDRKAVARLCVATRAVRPVGELIRFVAGPDGVLVPDIRARLPGRGVWVTNSADLLRQALARKAFQRSLRENIRIPDDLESQLTGLLRQDALQMLSLANKAGVVTSGFAKIEGIRGNILLLVQASDGSAAEIARLQRACRGKGPGRSDPVVILAFKADEIALSIGREHVIHAALTAHDTASVFLERALRYVGFLSGGPAKRQAASASGPSGIPEAVDETDAGQDLYARLPRHVAAAPED